MPLPYQLSHDQLSAVLLWRGQRFVFDVLAGTLTPELGGDPFRLEEFMPGTTTLGVEIVTAGLLVGNKDSYT
jgi:hypothetical protein